MGQQQRTINFTISLGQRPHKLFQNRQFSDLQIFSTKRYQDGTDRSYNTKHLEGTRTYKRGKLDCKIKMTACQFRLSQDGNRWGRKNDDLEVKRDSYRIGGLQIKGIEEQKLLRHIGDEADHTKQAEMYQHLLHQPQRFPPQNTLQCLL